jgi:hypothetical protein
MTEPTPSLPRGGGINGALIGADDTLPDKQRWNHLAEIRAIVGQCRDCCGDLQAVAPDEHDAQGEEGEVTWYEARCMSCGKVVAAPNGRVFRRSSAHRETPGDWLEGRRARDRALRDEIREAAGH